MLVVPLEHGVITGKHRSHTRHHACHSHITICSSCILGREALELEEAPDYALVLVPKSDV